MAGVEWSGQEGCRQVRYGCERQDMSGEARIGEVWLGNDRQEAIGSVW